jgi:hypothetical protein
MDRFQEEEAEEEEEKEKEEAEAREAWSWLSNASNTLPPPPWYAQAVPVHCWVEQRA